MTFRCLIDAVACTIGPVILLGMTTVLVLTMFSTAPPSQGGSAFGALLAVGSYAVLVSIPLKVARREADPRTLSRSLRVSAASPLACHLPRCSDGPAGCARVFSRSCTTLPLRWREPRKSGSRLRSRCGQARCCCWQALTTSSREPRTSDRQDRDWWYGTALHVGHRNLGWFAAMQAAHDWEGVCRRSGGFQLVTRWR